ncbi:MAG: hypothetical protein LBD03_00075 [Methanobrevibacter sp.]|nr:hypothetical protein [Candidatus Methanovirga procula]
MPFSIAYKCDVFHFSTFPVKFWVFHYFSSKKKKVTNFLMMYFQQYFYED